MDDFLSRFRENPRPEFTRTLYAKLKAGETASSRFTPRTWKPALVAAGLVVTATVAFSFPTVRTMAQNFLDLFRVKKFAAVAVSPERIEQLRGAKLDLKTLLSEGVRTVKERGEPKIVGDAASAGMVAGISVMSPTVLPSETVLDEIRVEGDEVIRFTADGRRLQAVLESLDITDIAAPESLDGAKITVTVPSAVRMKYLRGQRPLMFVQSRSPQVELPRGVDLAQLGEIALRVLGLSPAEASEFARTIDWHGTFVMPIPADAGSFREVSVRGVKGMLITSKNRPGMKSQGRGSILLWSEGEHVYAVAGEFSAVDLIEFANSLKP